MLGNNYIWNVEYIYYIYITYMKLLNIFDTFFYASSQRD